MKATSPKKNKPTRQRLDALICQKGLIDSRERAKAIILSGKVLVNGELIDKPGKEVLIDSTIEIRVEDHPFVSRGGVKLEAAIKTCCIDVSGKLCIDVGASTGGFTDCLLQNGAAHVYAIDVGYGQLAWKIRQDSRVTIMERTNIRYITPEAIPIQVDIIVIDTSFISLKIVVPAIMPFIKNEGRLITLIKPQFEVGKGKVGKGGIVRDPELHALVIKDLSDFFIEKGFIIDAVILSPIIGAKGNKEFIMVMTSTLA